MVGGSGRTWVIGSLLVLLPGCASAELSGERSLGTGRATSASGLVHYRQPVLFADTGATPAIRTASSNEPAAVPSPFPAPTAYVRDSQVTTWVACRPAEPAPAAAPPAPDGWPAQARIVALEPTSSATPRRRSARIIGVSGRDNSEERYFILPNAQP